MRLTHPVFNRYQRNRDDALYALLLQDLALNQAMIPLSLPAKLNAAEMIPITAGIR